MANNTDWLAGIEDDFQQPEMTKKVHRATRDAAGAGKYRRKTLLLPPTMIDFVADVAAQEGLKLMETYRWLLDAGISAYQQRELEIEDQGREVVYHRRPVMREW